MAEFPRKERKCGDCGGTNFVEDHAAGDIVCRGCGLVAEAHIIDERSEWRTFSDKDKDTADPNRVGGPTNPLLEGGGLTTVIGRNGGDGSYQLNKLHARSNNPDRNLNKAFKVIADLCEKLALVHGIKDRACELYKEVMDSGKLKGRSIQAVCAACLFLACRNENHHRTFREITDVLPSDASKKDIGRCFKDIMQMFKDRAMENPNGANAAIMSNVAPSAQHPADFIKRFGHQLDLGRPLVMICEKVARNAKPEDSSVAHKAWHGKNPISLAAAIIFIITQLKKPNVPMQNIVVATSVAEVTIRGAYRDLFPAVASLLPANFATPEEIERLPPPYTSTDAAVKHYCHELKLDEWSPACEKLAGQARLSEAAVARKPWHGKSVIQIAAAAVYIVATIKQADVTVESISEVSGVLPQSIQVTYAAMHSEISGMLPSNFATREELQRLPKP